MGKYRVKEPVTYVEGKKVVMHKRPAELVTIDDVVAKELGDKVELMGQLESDPSTTETTQTEPPAETRTEDETSTETPPVPTVEEARKARRRESGAGSS